MKQAVSRKKAVSPLPRKSYNQPKAAKKNAAAVAMKSGEPVSARAIKSVAAKSAPVVSARKTKPQIVVKQQKIAGKPRATAAVDKKTKASVGKTKPSVSNLPVKQTVKKPALKVVGKAVKATAAKAKPVIAAGKNRTAKVSAVAVKAKVAAQSAKQKTPKVASKVSIVKSAKPTAQSKLATPKNQSLKQKTSAVKNARAKVEKIVAPNKIVEKSNKPKTAVQAKKVIAAAPQSKTTTKPKNDAVQKISKTKQVVAVEKKSREPLKTVAPTAVEKPTRTARQVQPIAIQIATQPKAKKIQSSVAPTMAEAATKNKTKRVKVVAPVEIAPIKKAKAVAPPVEPVEVPLPKPRKKKVKPIGAAIFRGIKERYDFQVFPADGEFEDAAAIYIISRRVVDKNKRAHHKMVCIGQADSVLGDLKKHRKGKCFKQYQVNAISVLREENEVKRLKIAADLMSAHAIPCPHV